MAIDKERLLQVLRIGHDTSMRGEGLSLREALARSDYENLRKGFEASDLLPTLRADHDLVRQWVMYSEDKRTNGGFWVSEGSFEVGAPGSPESTVRHESLAEAVADFVIRELDFWSTIGRTTASTRRAKKARA